MVIRKPKEIIDRDALLAQLAPLDAHAEDRSPVTALLKAALQHGREVIAARFMASNKPAPYLAEMSYLVDELLIIATHAAARRHADAVLDKTIACLAVGGYGRSELFPYSDIDVLFLYREKESAIAKDMIESVLYYLWDMGLQVGHAVRTVPEAVRLAQGDHTITANLLDMRFVAGSQSLFDKLHSQFDKQVRNQNAVQFVEDKLNERSSRHHKHGNSRFLLEPNIKENKGGLRDLHMLHWLAKYIYDAGTLPELVALGVLSEKETRAFAQAEQFLWTVRVHLHLLAGRAEERLSFDVQKRIGEQLGYRTTHEHRPVERFMKRYFQVAKTIGDLTRLFCAILEEEHKRRPRIGWSWLLERSRSLDDFVIDGQRINFPQSVNLEQRPVLLLKLFHAAQAHQFDIHPRALQLVGRNLHLINQELRDNAEANALFMEMLLSAKGPEITFRRMNEAGVLGKFIPDFGRVVGQMQYDMYHIYTVDEHTIRALGILHSIEQGQHPKELPLATKVIQHIESRRVLYLALLCHDIAKGRGGNHSQLGEKIVYKLARRFGFDGIEAETCAWLVREHLLCTDTAFKRDLSDPKTIRDFVAKVQSPERLRLLLVLSVADTRAVGPQIWNGWKGSLMRELYYRSEEQIGTSSLDRRIGEIEQFKTAMTEQLAHWPSPERERYFEAGSPSFWLSQPVERQLEIANQLLALWSGQSDMGFHTAIDRFHSITHVVLCVPNRHALLRDIAGNMVLIGATILGAKIFTLRDGTAVAMFDIQNHENQAFDDEARLKKLRTNIGKTLRGELALAQEVQRHQPSYFGSSLQALDVPPSVFIDNKLSDKFTVIEVNGFDRIGFLYGVAGALADLQLNIATAHITTYGEKAVDVFYVKDSFGLKVEHRTKLEHIREGLLKVLARPPAKAQAV